MDRSQHQTRQPASPRDGEQQMGGEAALEAADSCDGSTGRYAASSASTAPPSAEDAPLRRQDSKRTAHSSAGVMDWLRDAALPSTRRRSSSSNSSSSSDPSCLEHVRTGAADGAAPPLLYSDPAVAFSLPRRQSTTEDTRTPDDTPVSEQEDGVAATREPGAPEGQDDKLWTRRAIASWVLGDSADAVSADTVGRERCRTGSDFSHVSGSESAETCSEDDEAATSCSGPKETSPPSSLSTDCFSDPDEHAPSRARSESAADDETWCSRSLHAPSSSRPRAASCAPSTAADNVRVSQLLDPYQTDDADDDDAGRAADWKLERWGLNGQCHEVTAPYLEELRGALVVKEALLDEAAQELERLEDLCAQFHAVAELDQDGAQQSWQAAVEWELCLGGWRRKVDDMKTTVAHLGMQLRIATMQAVSSASENAPSPCPQRLRPADAASKKAKEARRRSWSFPGKLYT